MAEKILNTRILLKYDSYANWTKNNPVLKAGEMAIATVANIEANKATGFQNLPNVVLKVGDGTSHYNDLKFVSALAADVHGWAKEADKPTYTYSEIKGLETYGGEHGGLENYIKSLSQGVDTDTHYNLVATDATNYKFELRSKEKSAVEWTKVADLDLSGIVSRVKALEDKFVGMEEATVVAHVQKKIEALDVAEVKVGQGEIIEAISEADGMISVTKRALAKEDIPTIEQSQVSGLVKALEDINTAIGDAEEGSLADANAYTDAEIRKLDYNGGEFGTSKFATKVTEADGVIAVEYAQPAIGDVSGLETRLSGIEGNVTNLTNNKQDNLGFEGEYNKETNKVVTKAHLTSVIEDLDSDGAGFGDHKFVTKVTEADGIVTPVYAQPIIADIDGLTDRLSGIDGEIAKKQDILGIVDGYNKETNKVATVQYVTDAVADLNGAMHFKGKLDSVPANTEGYNAGDVILVGYDEYVCDGNNWLALGNESIYQTKELATEQHNALTKLVTDLESKHDSEMDTLEKKHDDELAALDKKYGDIIAGLDAAEVKAGTGEIIDSVKEADGVVTVTKRALVAADIPELAQSKITGLEKALQDLNQAVTDAESGALQNAKDYSDAQLKAKVESLDYTDTAVAKQFVTSVSEADGIIAVTRAALVATDIPVIEQTQVNGLGDALAAAAKAGTDAAATAESNAKAYALEQIQGLDNTDAAVEKNFVTEVKQTDGAVAVKRAPVADIALTGNVNDLIQTTGDYLVFNCGNSQVGTANEFVM